MRTLLCLSCALLLACGGSPDPQPVAGDRTPLTTFERADAERIADALLTELGVENEQREAAMEAMKAQLDNPDFARDMASSGLAGVAAYRYGGGGLIISGGGGEGLATFASGSDGKPFAIRGWSFGLKAGAGKTFGVMLILGLKQESGFAETYTVRGVEGAGAKAGGMAQPGTGAHTLRLIGTRTGLSAGIDAGKMNIEWADKK